MKEFIESTVLGPQRGSRKYLPIFLEEMIV
jgi:hypothetical protein